MLPMLPMRRCLFPGLTAIVVVCVGVGCADIQAINDRLMAGSTPEGRCEQGDADSCDGLGWDTQEGRRPAPPTAAFWFEKACALGHRSACNSAGWQFHKGLGVDVDHARAALLFRAACPVETPADGTLDDAAKYACGNLGFLYEKGLGVTLDYPTSTTLYGLSCAGKMAASCFSLGIGYERGRGVVRDLVRARELYEFACTGGEHQGCANLGNLLLDGRGGPFDLPRAHQLLKAECDERNDGWACTSLGYAFANGVGVPVDVCRARALHEKSCAVDNPLGCGNLGASLVGTGCGAADVVRGRPLVEAACAQHRYACGSLGVLLEDSDPAGAVAAWTKGCDADDSHACLMLGRAARRGNGMAKDEARALKVLSKSCEFGRPDGCKDAVSLATARKSDTLPALQARACALGVGAC